MQQPLPTALCGLPGTAPGEPQRMAAEESHWWFTWSSSRWDGKDSLFLLPSAAHLELLWVSHREWLHGGSLCWLAWSCSRWAVESCWTAQGPMMSSAREGENGILPHELDPHLFCYVSHSALFHLKRKQRKAIIFQVGPSPCSSVLTCHHEERNEEN